MDLARKERIVANYYKVLEIPKTATSAQIREAYRKKCIQWHPDRNLGDKKAEEKFKCVAEAYGILIDESSRATYDKSLMENKKTKTRATEEPQQEYVNPKSESETFLMIAQVMMKLHEKGNSWSEIIKLLQEDGLSKDGVSTALALCFQVLKTSIPYKEMVDISSELHQEGADWVDIVDLIQKAGYSEKVAYRVLKDIAAIERKQDRNRSKGSTWISLLDALLRGLSNTEPRRTFSTKQNSSRTDSNYARRSWSRYY